MKLLNSAEMAVVERIARNYAGSDADRVGPFYMDDGTEVFKGQRGWEAVRHIAIRTWQDIAGRSVNLDFTRDPPNVEPMSRHLNAVIAAMSGD